MNQKETDFATPPTVVLGDWEDTVLVRARVRSKTIDRSSRGEVEAAIE